MYFNLKILLIGLACSVLMMFPYSGQSQTYPEAEFDRKIPTLEAVVGHATGQQISSFPEITSYMRALERSAPDRVKIVPYAKSWQGRELFYVVISSAENMSAIKDIKSDMQRLSSDSVLLTDINRIAASRPAVAGRLAAMRLMSVRRTLSEDKRCLLYTSDAADD